MNKRRPAGRSSTAAPGRRSTGAETGRRSQGAETGPRAAGAATSDTPASAARRQPGGTRPDDLVAGFRRDRRLLVGVVVVLAVLLVGGGMAFQAWRTGRSPTGVTAASSLAPASITSGQPILFGDPDAPVRLRLYEDFHCSHCADFEEAYAPTIDAAIDRDDAVVELYPMAFIDAGSARASNAMACAAEAGFGRAYYSGLFENVHLDWNEDQLVALGQAAAPTASVVAPTFDTCVRNDAHRAWVESINAAAAAAQVQQTPTLFVDDQPVDIRQLNPEALAADIARAAAARRTP